MGSATGRFVWHEIISKDPEASEKFYSALFGWEITSREFAPGMTYRFIENAGEMMGGIAPLEGNPDGPSHWMNYLWVDDVDSVAHRMPDLGGKVAVPPMDIPNIGRFSVVADPAGAYFAAYKGAQGEPPEQEGPPAVGSFTWDELLTTDPASALTFYKEVCGWESVNKDMGEMGTYHVFMRGDKQAAGMMKMPPNAGGPPAWLSYVAVDDVDRTAARVTELGGKIFVPPSDIPGMGRFSVAADDVGAAIAVFQSTQG